MKGNQKLIQITLPPADWDALNEQAKRHRRSLVQHIRELLGPAIDRAVAEATGGWE